MAFFEPLGDDRWRATAHTTGPWDARAQHGGPPSALMGRAIERTAPRDDVLVVRFTTEILGPVPVGELTLSSRVVRPGRSVELLEASLTAGGRECARASAWRVLRTEAGPTAAATTTPPPLPETGSPWGAEGWIDGYLSAIEWRLAAGSAAERGPATIWTRMLQPLVPDEEPSGLQRALVVADSGNGVSNELDLREHLFINPELTVHLHREPIGEWICLDAQTAISPGGAGLATTTLYDTTGPVGAGGQSLLVAPR